MRNPCLRGAFFFAPNAVFLRFRAFRWWQVGAADTIGEVYAVRMTEETCVTCSVLHVPVQRAAIARAARCVGRCTALRWPMHRTASFVPDYSPVAGSAVCPSAQPPPAGRRCLSLVGPKPLGICTLALGECRLGRWANCPVPCVGRWGRLPSRMRCAAHIWPLRKKTARKAKKCPPYLYVNQIQ